MNNLLTYHRCPPEYYFPFSYVGEGAGDEVVASDLEGRNRGPSEDEVARIQPGKQS